jgi:ketosteroid isomerase-like protein
MLIQPEEVRILGDRAYSHGTYELEMAPKAGGEPQRYSGKFLDVLEKQIDGSWKIAIDCHNCNASSA